MTEWRSGTVSVFLNRGGALMQQPVNYPAGPGAGGVAIGDLNGDGNLDLATSNFADGSVSVLLNRGNGTFEPERAYPTGTRPEAVATGDLNGDGQLDLATVNLDGSVSVLLNGGDGTFEPRIDYATGESPQSFALGDVNGDGRPDVATGNEKDLSVLLNRGDGSLGTKRNYRVGRFSGGVAIGDLNGDGRPDLAVTHQVNALAEVAVLLNQGAGSFLPKRDYAVGDEPEGVVIGKFDRNRLRDLATANSEAGSVTVLLNSTGGCGVPRIERKPLPAAERAIERDGCRVGRIRYVHARLQRDRVISQAPWAGRVLPAGGSVDLVVSLGLER